MEKYVFRSQGVKLAKNRGWGYRWGYKVGLHFRKTGVTKLLPEHTVRGGKNEPKNGVEYRKLTLSVQLFFSIYLIIYRIKW